MTDLASPSGVCVYEVRLAGHLDDRWSGWLDARALVRDEDACTTLTVEIADQAQLHGLLSRIRDLGITLLSLTTVPPGPIASVPGCGPS